MNTLKINHAAVWICIVLMHVFGFLWYGPFFGDAWMAYVGIDQSSMQEDSMNPMIWVLNSVAIIVPMYALAWLLMKMNVTSGTQGALIAFVATFCFHMLPTLNAGMFADEPAGLAWITSGYSVTWLTISGYVLGAWVKKTA
jgi:hypothetical protein